jgi:hypothetical protein
VGDISPEQARISAISSSSRISSSATSCASCSVCPGQLLDPVPDLDEGPEHPLAEVARRVGGPGLHFLDPSL